MHTPGEDSSRQEIWSLRVRLKWRDMKGVLLYDASQQGLPFERPFMTYLFVEFAERTLYA